MLIAGLGVKNVCHVSDLGENKDAEINRAEINLHLSERDLNYYLKFALTSYNKLYKVYLAHQLVYVNGLPPSCQDPGLLQKFALVVIYF